MLVHSGNTGHLESTQNPVVAERNFPLPLEAFQQLLDSLPNAVVLVDGGGRVVLANTQVEMVCGYRSDELLGQPVELLLPELLRASHPGHWAGPFDEPHLRYMGRGLDMYARRKDRSEFPVRVSLGPVHAGKELFVVATICDINSHRGAEEVLRRSEKNLRKQNEILVELSTRKILDGGNLPGVVREITKVAARTLEVERASVWLYNDDHSKIRCLNLYEQSRDRHSEGLELEAASCPSYFKALQEGRSLAVHDACADPRTIEFSKLYLSPLGIMSMLGAPIRVGGQMVGVVCHEHVGSRRQWTLEEQQFAGSMADLVSLALEASEHKRVEEALRRSEARSRSAIESAPYGIYQSTLEGRFLGVNPALVEMLGYASEEELLALSMATDVYRSPADREHLLDQYRTRKSFTGIEVKWKRKDSHVITVRLSGRLVRDEVAQQSYFDVIAEDITQQRALEEQLRQSQKMEAIGQLAGGVAHDFNNLLMVVRGYSELLLTEVDVSDSVRRSVIRIQTAADQAASLTQQLLAFGRKQMLQPEILNLNEVLSEAKKLLGRVMQEDIELVTVKDPRLKFVKVDQGQFQQVLQNLVVNARDAMPQGGRLLLQTTQVELEDGHAFVRGGLEPGPYVLLSVSDTGVGMDKETQARIFEPFFTTKEIGKGTGLGLATVYGIVKQSGGHILVESEIGQGTTFKVYLPAVEQRGEDLRSSVSAVSWSRRVETILLVEDDPSVRNLVRQLLEVKGYTVLEAGGSRRALQVCRSHRGKIHLLVTDLVMPQVSGRDLAQILAPLCPEMKVLYMSGYSDISAQQNNLLERGVPLLQKPFTLEAMTRKVREVLDGGAVPL